MTTTITRLLLPLALTTFAAAQSLTGRIVDPTGVPIAGITVDPGSGGATPGVSDAFGNFTITGLNNNHTYDFEYLPPFAAPWAARIVTTTIVGATAIGDVTLQPGFALSGVAHTQSGLGVLGCNLNVYAQDGTKLFTPHDGTDALGNFSVTIPAGTWDVRVVPPVGALMVATTIEDVAVAAATNLGVVTLRTGYTVTGTVVDSVSLVPVGQTRIRAFDALTGERILLPVDTVNTFGQFTILLPYGLLDLWFEPPLGNTHVARMMLGVAVPGPTALGNVRLQNGALLSGTVTANGSPVAGADIDVLLADGSKVFTPNDTTTAAGAFSVAVPLGAGHRVRVEPTTTGLVGALSGPVQVAGATNVGTITLAAGIAVSGTVTSPSGPEVDAALHFVDPASNTELVTSFDHTGGQGHYTTWVPAGTWQVSVTTAEGSFAQGTNPQSLTVSAPTTFNAALPAKLARTAVTSFGTPTLPQGALLPINVLLHSMVPGLQTILVDLSVEMPGQPPVVLLPGLPLTLPQIPFQIDFLWVPYPLVPAPLLGKEIDMVITLRDATGNVVLDRAKTPFVVE